MTALCFATTQNWILWRRSSETNISTHRVHVFSRWLKDKQISTQYRKVNKKTAGPNYTRRVDDIQKQVEFYKTTIENCNCSENIAISERLKKDVPCSHRGYLRASFPELIIVRYNQYENLEIKINFVSPEAAEVLKVKDELEKEYVFEKPSIWYSFSRWNGKSWILLMRIINKQKLLLSNESAQVIELISDDIHTCS